LDLFKEKDEQETTLKTFDPNDGIILDMVLNLDEIQPKPKQKPKKKKEDTK